MQKIVPPSNILNGDDMPTISNDDNDNEDNDIIGPKMSAVSSFDPSLLRPDPNKYRRESTSARRIFDFKSYRDGQLFHFVVPLDAKAATWKLRTNYTAGCRPGMVSV